MKYTKNFYQVKSNTEIFNRIKSERKSIGYYDLPYQDTTKIKNYAESINKKHIVVLGIGGSSLGARAIYEFLLPSANYSKDLLFLEVIDQPKIDHSLKKIDLSDAQFVVISKSGNTIETISIFKYLNSLVTIDGSNCTIISEVKSKLTQFAKDNNIESFCLEENITGRFSVFSAVGLLPLAMVGVNIDNLLNGCKSMSESFFNKKKYYKSIMEKSRFFIENKDKYNINAVFSYSPTLEAFNKWYVQIWAESFGRVDVNGTHQGLTAIALLGPNEHHSFLQLIITGRRDKIITFIKINDSKHLKIKLKKLGLNCKAGLNFDELINKQADLMIESVNAKKDIPYDVISFLTIDEYNIAKLIFSYQLMVSIIGQFLQINVYDQSNVENSKKLSSEAWS